MPYTEETDIFPVMLSLASATSDELSAAELPVDYAYLQAGAEPVIDHAGNGKSCSELIVNLVAAIPVDNFPAVAEVATCGSQFGYEVQVGVFRCAPTISGRNNTTPSVEDQIASTRMHLADMAAVKRSICKTLRDRHYVIRGFAPYGPEGGAVGGTWLIFIGPER